MSTKEQKADVYDFRNKALAKTKRRLEKRGITTTPLKLKDKRAWGADFKIDNLYCKFKSVRQPQSQILFETKNGSRPGWFNKSRADKLFYFVDGDSVIYIIDIKRVKEYIKNPINYVQTTTKGFFDGGCGFIIPIEKMYECNMITSTINI